MNIDQLQDPGNPYQLSQRVLADLGASGLATDLWPIIASGDRCVLAVTEQGLFVFSPTGDSARGWKGIFDLDISTEAIAFNLTRSGDSRYYRLANPADASEIAAAARAHGKDIRVVEPSQQDWVRTKADKPAANAVEPRSAAGSPAHARSVLTQLFWGGVALQIIAGIIAGATWVGTDPETGESTGSEGGVVFGYVVGSIGTVVVFVALTGWAVMLGVRAARTDG